VDTRDNNGWTALITAEERNNNHVAQLLRARGAKREEAPDLIKAAARGDTATVQALLRSKSSSINGKNGRYGKTPLKD
jgi:ankyrin repeat protein